MALQSLVSDRTRPSARDLTGGWLTRVGSSSSAPSPPVALCIKADAVPEKHPHSPSRTRAGGKGRTHPLAHSSFLITSESTGSAWKKDLSHQVGSAISGSPAEYNWITSLPTSPRG